MKSSLAIIGAGALISGAVLVQAAPVPQMLMQPGYAAKATVQAPFQRKEDQLTHRGLNDVIKTGEHTADTLAHGDQVLDSDHDMADASKALDSLDTGALKLQEDTKKPPYIPHDPELHGPVGSSLHFVMDEKKVNDNLQRVNHEANYLWTLRNQGPQHIAAKQLSIDSIKNQLHVSKDPAADRFRIAQLEKEKEIVGSKVPVIDQWYRKMEERNMWVEERLAAGVHLNYATEQRAARLRWEKEKAEGKHKVSPPNEFEAKGDNAAHAILPQEPVQPQSVVALPEQQARLDPIARERKRKMLSRFLNERQVYARKGYDGRRGDRAW